MIRSAAPTVFESFNARALEPDQVARTFVPSAHYDRLAKRSHTLIVGPRGSGKTTLLKMLQPAALEAWQHPIADRYRRSIDFTGVFIPTDVSWNGQLASLGHSFSAQDADLLTRAAFTTHVLRALVMAMEYRVHSRPAERARTFRRVDLPREKEAELIRQVSDAWSVTSRVLSLQSLKFALSGRLSEIRQFASAEERRAPAGRQERFASAAFLHLDFLQSVLLAIEVFDAFVPESGAKWALLFDELELAPTWLTDELLRSLRSADSRLLFKLSMSPFATTVGHLTTPLAAQPGHDYDAVALWYAHKEDSYDFSKRLLESMLSEAGLVAVDPQELLGPSEFDTRVSGTGATEPAYTPGSPLQRRVVRMAEADPTFRSHLRDRGIDAEFLHELSEDVRAAEIRKIAPLLAVREAFRTAPDSKHPRQRIRSRKNPGLYAGASSLFAIVEGNPRWFIGILNQLLDTVQTDVDMPIGAAKQNHAVQAAASRFRALLRTIPCPPLTSGAKPRGVLAVLDRIGTFLFNEIVVADFNPDPPGSFVVDSHTSEELIDSLGKALNAGALVYVPDAASELVLGSLRGKRFRLSYLLATHYGLPLRLGRQVALSSIVTQQGSLPLALDEEGTS